ncbi:MAG TPA: hypothetical protein HA254_06395 [Candidatus Diapherotrites archaeon]|uniref:DUF5320 domain-containing protein n=1 Tax=Candidatus Iainarchaeum sp. TaxID=3101447 RepID=A0A7J4J1J5_9ARCH|nr:hypothetical protein [Candidatus Diapherotrites archaeon]
MPARRAYSAGRLEELSEILPESGPGGRPGGLGSGIRGISEGFLGVYAPGKKSGPWENEDYQNAPYEGNGGGEFRPHSRPRRPEDKLRGGAIKGKGKTKANARRDGKNDA